MNREQIEKKVFDKTMERIAKTNEMTGAAAISAIQNLLIQKGILTGKEIADSTEICLNLLMERMAKKVKFKIEKMSTKELSILKEGFSLIGPDEATEQDFKDERDSLKN